jgi:hypothetical protein
VLKFSGEFWENGTENLLVNVSAVTYRVFQKELYN